MLIVLAAVLTAVCIFTIRSQGQTYDLIKEYDASLDLEDIKIEYDWMDGRKVVEETGRQIEEGRLRISYRSAASGSCIVLIDLGDGISDNAYFEVHDNGVITCGSKFGECKGDIVIPISLSIFFAALLVCLISDYIRTSRYNIYQYRNITFLGLAIFTGILLIVQILAIFGGRSLESVIGQLMFAAQTASFATLPLAIIATVVVTISNIVLIVREGRSLGNLLGLILGLAICLGAFFPTALYLALTNASSFDIHDAGSAPAYLEMFMESFAINTAVYLECILVATIVCAIKAARHIPSFDKDYIVILGCMIRKDGTLTTLLRARADKALEFAKMQKEKTGKDILFVPSGGQGDDECMPEGRAIANYLISQGVPEDHIIVEDKSVNTMENIRFSFMLAEERVPGGKMAISTTNYHVLRAGAYAFKQGINAEGIGSPTKAYFWANAFIREFIASVISERKLHITAVIVLMLVTFALSMTLYSMA